MEYVYFSNRSEQLRILKYSDGEEKDHIKGAVQNKFCG